MDPTVFDICWYLLPRCDIPSVHLSYNSIVQSMGLAGFSLLIFKCGIFRSCMGQLEAIHPGGPYLQICILGKLAIFYDFFFFWNKIN